MKALFLDIDGVCNDRAFVRAALEGSTITRWSADLARKTLDPVRVARVQRICDATDARIVIVSGWRRWAPVEDIAACLASAGLRAEILGAVGGAMFSADLRAHATLEWLAAHPDVARWCVVDDDRASWDPRITGCEREVFAWRCVHPVDGITDDDATNAIRALSTHHMTGRGR